MVGVAGRSRSCLTCRARRKGCDQQRPICGQCERANLTCRGYPNTIAVVHYNHHGFGSTRYISTRKTPVLEERSAPVTIADRTLIQALLESGLVDAYWNLLFPVPNESGISAMEHNYSVSAVFELGNKWRDDRLIKTGMQALTSAAMGRTHDDQRMANTALQAYSKALYTVNQSLQHPEKCKSDSVLAACKLLATYEVQAGVGFNYERHTLGTQQLLIVRGPLKHTTGLAHTLFLDARLHVTIVALKRRERTPLADPQWQQIPWTYHPKDLRQKLLDVMIQLPAILAEFDAIKAVKCTSIDTAKRRRHFFERCGRLHDEAESWLHILETAIGTHLYITVKDMIRPEFPLRYFSLAYTISIYWVFCLILHDTVRLALQEFPVSHCAITPQDVDAWCNPDPFALRIVNSASYFFQPNAGTFPSAMFSFPMGMTMNYFAYKYKGSHPQYLTVVQWFKQGKTGEIVGKFLRSLQATTDPIKDPMKTFDQEENPSEEYEQERIRAKHWYEKGERSRLKEDAAGLGKNIGMVELGGEP